MSYYNTTNETGTSLEEGWEQAENQKEIILKYFRQCRAPRTPREVFTYFREKWLIGSVRRSITDLTTEGFLEKLDKKKMGPYGRNEYCWQYKRQDVKAEQAELF